MCNRDIIKYIGTFIMYNFFYLLNADYYEIYELNNIF